MLRSTSSELVIPEFGLEDDKSPKSIFKHLFDYVSSLKTEPFNYSSPSLINVRFGSKSFLVDESILMTWIDQNSTEKTDKTLWFMHNRERAFSFIYFNQWKQSPNEQVDKKFESDPMGIILGLLYFNRGFPIDRLVLNLQAFVLRIQGSEIKEQNDPRTAMYILHYIQKYIKGIGSDKQLHPDVQIGLLTYHRNRKDLQFPESKSPFTLVASSNNALPKNPSVLCQPREIGFHDFFCPEPFFKSPENTVLVFKSASVTEYAVRNSLIELINTYFKDIGVKICSIRTIASEHYRFTVMVINTKILNKINIFHTIKQRLTRTEAVVLYRYFDLSEYFYSLRETRFVSDKQDLCEYLALIFGINPIHVKYDEARWKVMENLLTHLGDPKDENKAFVNFLADVEYWSMVIPFILIGSEGKDHYIHSEEKEEIKDIKWDKINSLILKSLGGVKAPFLRLKLRSDHSIVKGQVQKPFPDLAAIHTGECKLIPLKLGLKKIEHVFLTADRGYYETKNYEYCKDENNDISFRLNSSFPIRIDCTEHPSPLLHSFLIPRCIYSLYTRKSWEY